jgi:Ca-activated chloride channel family protein
MSFSHSFILLGLIVPVLLIVWAWRRSDGRIVLPYDHGLPGTGTAWRVLLALAEALPPLLLAVVIVILAGPQRLTEPKEKRVMTNIEMCVDVSGSMTTPFGDGTRYDTAMKAVDEFCTYRKGDAYGLTFFGNNELHWCPLTSDVSAVRCSPPFMQPDKLPPWFNGTEIGRALRACRKVLAERQEGDRMILLITDGDSYDLNGGNDVAIAKELKADNISVYAIIIGMDRIQDEIHTITGQTGGDAFQAGDPEALKAVFKRIDQMKQTRLEKTVADTVEWLFPFSAAGLGLCGLCTLTWFGLRYTPW